MNTRNQNLLVIALATALATPLAAIAQTETTQEQLDQAQVDRTLPPQANPVEEAEQAVDPRVPVEEDAEDPMSAVPPPPPPPEQSQGASQAMDHSAVVQRARWAELDSDGDGRISADEGTVDADFAADFEMMDADGDGFVSDTEFRAYAKASPPREDHMDDGRMKHDMDAMDHDGMGHDDRMQNMQDRMDDDDAADSGMDEGMDDPVEDDGTGGDAS